MIHPFRLLITSLSETIRSGKKVPSQKAFTLIELLVTIAIVMLVTGMALVRYGSFNNTILLKSQALEIALNIRQAQQYAISVSNFTGDTANAFGIHFALDNSSNSYILYQDTIGGHNLTYTKTSTQDEQVGQPYVIDPRFVLQKVCSNSSCSRQQASISFKRPNFDAHLFYGPSQTPVSRIDIYVAPANDATSHKVISVYSSGQITVQ